MNSNRIQLFFNLAFLLHELPDHVKLDVADLFLNVIFHHVYICIQFFINLLLYVLRQVDFNPFRYTNNSRLIAHLLVKDLWLQIRRLFYHWTFYHVELNIIYFHWVIFLSNWFVDHLNRSSFEFTKFLFEVLWTCSVSGWLG